MVCKPFDCFHGRALSSKDGRVFFYTYTINNASKPFAE